MVGNNKNNILYSSRPMLRDHMPFKIRLKGIASMNDDPKEIHVLYAKVQKVDAPRGMLQDLADTLVEYFCKAGEEK